MESWTGYNLGCVERNTPPPIQTRDAEDVPRAMSSRAGLTVSRKRPGPLAYLSCIRYQEVLVLQGSPLLGAAFALGPVTTETIARVLAFALGGFLLVAHIFSFNDWAGTTADSRDPNKAASVFSTKGVSRRSVLLLSAGLLVAALLIFLLFSRQTLMLAVAIAVLGILYSHPATNAKGIPVVSSCPHLLGGLLHFLLGYSLLRPIDRRGTLIALFFALTFTAGHLNQEVRDHDGDRLNGLSTNAVAFGRTPVFLAGLLGFTLAYADLAYLAYAGLVAPVLGLLPLLLYPMHVAWSLSTLRAGLTFESVSRFQSRYRALYALIGLTMLVTLLTR
jgi:4-hydroxybenzoate polyprenyltransferase